MMHLLFIYFSNIIFIINTNILLLSGVVELETTFSEEKWMIFAVPSPEAVARKSPSGLHFTELIHSENNISISNSLFMNIIFNFYGYQQKF